MEEYDVDTAPASWRRNVATEASTPVSFNVPRPVTSTGGPRMSCAKEIG
jgi:hypothetical protein